MYPICSTDSIQDTFSQIQSQEGRGMRRHVSVTAIKTPCIVDTHVACPTMPLCDSLRPYDCVWNLVTMAYRVRMGAPLSTRAETGTNVHAWVLGPIVATRRYSQYWSIWANCIPFSVHRMRIRARTLYTMPLPWSGVPIGTLVGV
jgi:hypothetical protein